MAFTEADLSAASAQAINDGYALLAVIQTERALAAADAALVAGDKSAALAAAERAEAAASSVGAGGNGNVLAQEGENFTVPDGTIVRFGTGSNWVEKTFDGSPHVCNLPTFGTDVDPAPNQVKQCVLGHYTGS
jgi:hypothetical protein